MSLMLHAADNLTFTSEDDGVRGCPDNQKTGLKDHSKHGQNLDSDQHNSIDGVVSPDEMESLDDADDVDHKMSSADRNGQFLVIKAETGSVFQNQDGKPEFVDQSSSENKELSFVCQGFSSQDNQLSSLNEQLPSFHNDESVKDESVLMFQTRGIKETSKHGQNLNSGQQNSIGGVVSPDQMQSLEDADESSSQDISSIKDEPVSMFQNDEQSPSETRSFKMPSKRTELTLEEKVFKNYGMGKSQRQLAQMFGISKSRVQTILKCRPEILKAYKQKRASDRIRFGKHAENNDVNRLTWEWFQEMSKTKGIQLNGPMLQEQAKQFAKQLGHTDFKASNGWLFGFRKRHNIQSSTQGWSIGSGLDSHLNKSDSAVSSCPRNSDNKVKRVELTLQEKVELLRIHHQNGESQKQLAKMFGISRCQTQSVLKRKDDIFDQYENNANLARKRICRRTSVVENNDVNRLTLEWINEMSKLERVTVTGPMVQKKAKCIAAELGRTEFKASKGWLDCFRKRNSIVFFFSKNANNSTAEEIVEEIAVRLPSSFNTSVDSLHSEPDTRRNLRSVAVHGKTVSSSELDILGTIKKEPEDVSEKPGCSEPAIQPRGNKNTLPNSDSSDDDEDSNSDSDSDKSQTDSEGERTAAIQTLLTSVSSITNKHGKDKPVPADKKKESVLQRSSVETIQKAVVMSKQLKLFCEDNSLTQLSVMLDFVERQLQMKHSDTSKN